MKHCERQETLVSTWLDGQLDERSDQIECLDHLVRCAPCRRFYLDARALDGLVASVRTPADAAAPSPEVWKRVQWATSRARADRSRRRLPAWALQAAAVLVIAAGLSVAAWRGGTGAPAPAQAEVILGASAAMTDARFIELTKEVLGANRRYHTAMRQIMEQVARDTAVPGEAAPEDDGAPPGELGPRESVEIGPRLPA